jgi:hypothetical protein
MGFCHCHWEYEIIDTRLKIQVKKIAVGFFMLFVLYGFGDSKDNKIPG